VLVTSLLETGQLDGSEHDYIVVGAGAAGCALAAALTADPSRSVLLIEAGRNFGRVDQYPALLQRPDRFSFTLHPGQEYPARSQYRQFTWCYEGNLNGLRRATIVRGRVVGGSSAVNGASFTRGRPTDYDGWAAAGNTEWSFEKVLPAFRSIETDLDFGQSEVHGSSGPLRVQRTHEDQLSAPALAFVDAALDAAFPWDPDLNGLSKGGVGLSPRNVVDGIRQNAGAAFVDRVLARRNLSLLDRTVVRRVLMDRDRAIGIEAGQRGAFHHLRAGEVILCAGGINSPHLLLLSGIGPADALLQFGIEPRLDQPHVGANLSDHPTLDLPCALGDPTDDGRRRGGVSLNYSSIGSSDDEDMRLMFVNGPPESHHGGARSVAFHCNIGVPESRGRLVLRSASPFRPPSIEFNYLSEAGDRRRMREGVRMAADFVRHPSFRRLGAELSGLTSRELGDDAALDEWVAANLGTAYHSGGTCKMGPDSDDGAVVDQYCRVRGVDGLRVADASIVPTLTTRGLHATAVMIGQHAASLISGEPN
jgi:predicted dehydrogenase (TIGR03970 family)